MSIGFVRTALAVSTLALLSACGSSSNSGSSKATIPVIKEDPVAFSASEYQDKCPSGGDLVTSFSDANRNGKRDTGENISQAFYCAGKLAFKQDYSLAVEVSESPVKLDPLTERTLKLDFTLSQLPQETLSFDYALSSDTATEGEDFVATSGSVVFARGETTKSITLTIKHDTLNENHEVFVVAISNQVNTDLSDIKVKINDDDGIKISFEQAQSRIIESSNSTATVTNTLVVKLSEALTSDIQVPFIMQSDKVSNQFGVPQSGVDYRVVVNNGRFPLGQNEKCNASDTLEPLSSAKGCLTFKAGETQNSIEITAIDDDLAEGREKVDVKLYLVDAVSSGDNANHILSISDAALSIQSNNKHSCVQSEDTTLKCWGNNLHGQLGFTTAGFPVGVFANSLQGNSAEVKFVFDSKSDTNAGAQTPPKLTAYNLGFLHTCALFDNGEVKCWGYNASGQLGNGTTANVNNLSDLSTEISSVKLTENAKSLALGASHSCALLNNGKVKCWGGSRFGQLGLGNTTAITGESKEQLAALDLSIDESGVKQLASGPYHNCVVFNSGKVACWGQNQYGQLGIGENTGKSQNIGDEAQEMGENLQLVDLGTNKTAKFIALGHRHTCALLNDDSVKCWGDNAFGQLGQGNTEALGDKANQMGDVLTAIDFGDNFEVKQLLVGGFHSCVIGHIDSVTSEQKVKCWGRNRYGQLGYEDTNNRGDNADEMGSNLKTLAFPEGRMPLSFTQGQTTIALGQNHSCAILDNKQIKCWGFSDNGQLGLENTENIADGLVINPDFDSSKKVEDDHPEGDCQPGNRRIPVTCDSVKPELSNPDIVTQVF